MFFIIGLGLCDEKDITIRGLEAIKSATRVYLEAYTSILMVQKAQLESFYGKEIIVADRDLVECGSDEILKDADKEDVCLLVVGDPFGATTHTDILLRARHLGIPTRVIHNASIINAVGASGLQLYNFGQTVSLVFFTETWKPDSFYDRIKENAEGGLHTLLLLDIKVKEQSEENLARGRKIYEPPRYMTVRQAVSQLLEIEALREEGVLDADKTLAVAMGRVGGLDNQRILAGPLSSFLRAPPDAFGPPLHSMIIVGKRLHHLEVEYGEVFAETLGEVVALSESDLEGEARYELRDKGRKEGREKWRDVASKVYGLVLD
ncbi:tetrapyrrole methylase [Lentinula aciculospora]|uniref:diphthine methyl ester synthase n=1 Tax=Lentinula aciculospora TaxID=153920 RepID=A0A9W9DRY0_9AGAR|nr:tetrapyrrole methylase [Lentinula aciculospora]